MEAASVIAVVAVIGSFGAAVVGPILSYRAGQKKQPAEIDSEVTRASKELVDATTVVVGILRQELSVLRERLDEVNESQKITNGKGVPEPAAPLLYEKITEIQNKLTELSEKAFDMSRIQDESTIKQQEIKDQTENLSQAVSGIEEYFEDFMRVWKHNVDVAEGGGMIGLEKPGDFKPHIFNDD